MNKRSLRRKANGKRRKRKKYMKFEIQVTRSRNVGTLNVGWLETHLNMHMTLVTITAHHTASIGRWMKSVKITSKIFQLKLFPGIQFHLLWKCCDLHTFFVHDPRQRCRASRTLLCVQPFLLVFFSRLLRSFFIFFASLYFGPVCQSGKEKEIFIMFYYN